MKLKTYFITLVLFLLFFNASIFVLSVVTLKNNLNSIQDRCLAEHYFIVSDYAKDLYALENRKIPLDTALKSLFQTYDNYYRKHKVLLVISKDAESLYSSVPKEENIFGKLDTKTVESRTVLIQKLKNKQYIMIIGKLPAPYSEYTIAYLYDLSNVTGTWNRMIDMLYLGGMILSALLAVCLMLLLTHIFKPLKQISIASRSIATGKYDNRIIINGHDELAEMGEDFNHMAEEIQSQMNQLTIAVEQRQRFIDNLAHELRTPLTTIYGYAEYIQKVVITENDKLMATDYIMSESRRLQNIAYRLLDLAVLRNNQINSNEIVMRKLFDTTEETMRIKTSVKNVELKCVCEIEKITGDVDLLESLLINLVDNAVKACDVGGKVELRSSWEDGLKVITIQDNGKGMTEEQLSHITEEFYRVDKSRSRIEGGAGLGLSICEQIAYCHGAKISFFSEPGEGTTVKITFTSS